MKPLLIFGLRGTLLERLHVRNIPPSMPTPDLTVGVHKIWLRAHMLDTLLALQPHCRLAIWSSTTARNTAPLIEAIFYNQAFLQHHIGHQADSAQHSSTTTSTPLTAAKVGPRTETAAPSASHKGKSGKRFDKRTVTTTTAATSEDGSAIAEGRAGGASEETTGVAGAPAWRSPFKFEFVWSREYTSPDEFRRMNVHTRDDEYATVKNLDTVFSHFPQIALPQKTVLIDDTPSKAKVHAANFMWLDTCELDNIRDADSMLRLREWVEKELLKTEDVRTILPQRIRVKL